jgi:hypothetical protein
MSRTLSVCSWSSATTKLGVRVVDHIGHLGEDGVLVDAQWPALEALGGQFGIDPFRPVVADDGQGIVILKAQGSQAQGEVFYMLIV